MLSSHIRHGRSWKKGHGKRSKARIGYKKKSRIVQEPLLPPDPPVQPTPVHPSQWLSNISLPNDWTAVGHETELRLCQISSQTMLCVSPLAVTRSLVVKADYSWILHVNNHLVDPQKIPSLSDFPSFVDAKATSDLLVAVCALNTCAGNPDPKFVTLAKSRKNAQFLSKKNEVVAYLDSGFCVLFDDQPFVSTVRCSSCPMLTDRSRCLVCGVYRNQLLTMSYRFEKRKSAPRSRSTNYM